MSSRAETDERARRTGRTVPILNDLIGGLRMDTPAREVRVGRFWTAVWSRECGLASTAGPDDHEHGTCPPAAPACVDRHYPVSLENQALDETADPRCERPEVDLGGRLA
jgi:hypothetical protein